MSNGIPHITYPPPSPYRTQTLNAQQYDTQEANKLQTQMLFGLVIIMGMHYQWNYVQPLYFQVCGETGFLCVLLACSWRPPPVYSSQSSMGSLSALLTVFDELPPFLASPGVCAGSLTQLVISYECEQQQTRVPALFVSYTCI